MDIYTEYTIEGLRRKVQELSILYEISRVLGVSLQLSEALGTILDILARNMDMNSGIIILLDSDTKRPYMEFTHGLSSESGRHIGEVRHDILEKIIKIGSPMVGYKKEGLIRIIHAGSNIAVEETFFLAVPVKTHEDIIGILVVDRLLNEQTIEEDINLLSSIASLIAQRIEMFKRLEEEKRRLFQEKLAFQRETKVSYRFSNIIYQSEKMKEVLDLAWRVSQSKATVLLRGESGTGKELIARAIHYHSRRCDKPFISVNCAAIPDTLIESELFGHERGAFTGATQMRRGKFELAHEGTLNNFT